MIYKNKFLDRSLKKTKAKLSETGENISDKFNDLEYQTLKSVKRHPYKALGITFLAGLLVAEIFNIRK